MKENKALTVFLSIITALFILSLSIAVPILFRPFYYMQITPLALEEDTGLSREEIITSYDEMLDFCIGVRKEFSTGVLKWSESGKAHFIDVKGLFLLDLRIAVLSGIILVSWRIGKRRLRICPYRFFHKGPGFWGSIGLITVFVLVGLLGATDFERAFRVFHMIFFPGKDNWIFNPDTDQIIRILPEVFFRNCAILALIVIFMLCAVFICMDIRRKDERTL